MNLEAARSQMLAQQIRAWEVLDERVLDVLRDTPREQFAPEEYRDLAFADMEIPLGHGQSMMAPNVEGRLLQALQIQPADEVLEIGTGSGYLAACLAKLAGKLMSVDIFSDFTADAAENLRRVRISNVEIQTADAMSLSFRDQFDAIAVTASTPDLTSHFIDMLRPHGRLFIVVGRAPVMEARLIEKSTRGDWTEQSLFETLLTPLINAEASEPFVL